ncbi:MAG: hypothetical protein AB2A00_31170 [Myxococcota bacterium]
MIAFLVLAAGGLLALEVASRNYQAELRALRPGDVISITLEISSSGDRVELTEEERAELLRLLTSATRMSPNHPSGVWTCYVRIRAKSRDHEFRMSATGNNGTVVWLFSNGSDGWNLGTLRNDGFRPFVERVAARYWGRPLRPGSLSPEKP